jgi:hypothetical protein
MKLALDLFRPRAPEADALGAFVAALVLTGLGLICVYSFGGEQVVRQAAWAALAVASSIAVSRVPLDRLRRAAIPALAVSAALLVTALLFAPSIAGTKRWLVIGSIGVFQRRRSRRSPSSSSSRRGSRTRARARRFSRASGRSRPSASSSSSPRTSARPSSSPRS